MATTKALTINEALVWMKTLQGRHGELVALRNENSAKERHFYGAHADKEIVKEPTYDVRVLDKMVARLAREMRVLEQAIKSTNGVTRAEAYDGTATHLRDEKPTAMTPLQALRRIERGGL